MSDEFREFNPLDYENLTKHCVDELMRRTPRPLPIQEKFPGAGVYALFYKGKFPAYRRVCSPNCEWPIYVGKAVPKGGRKGGGVKKGQGRGTELWKRLDEHARSLQEVANLAPSDFLCRFMVVTPLWISMTERFLLETYRPIWNVALDGFGNHDPGAKRHGGMITWWDALHPGRTWAKKLQQARSAKDAQSRVEKYLSTYDLKPASFSFEEVVAEPEAGVEESSE
jgi:hypothetical protein